MIEELLQRARAFEAEAHAILASHESSTLSRVVLLDQTYRKLSKLSLSQDELIRQALTCTQYGLNWPAHVMAWAGFIDFLEEKLASDQLVKLRAARPGWPKLGMEELREQFTEFQLIETARLVGLCNRGEMKAMHGLLNKRNECAHPSGYWPDPNQTVGYVAEVLGRIEELQKRSL